MRLPHWLRRREVRVSLDEQTYGDVRITSACEWYLTRFRKRVRIVQVRADMSSLGESWPR